MRDLPKRSEGAGLDAWDALHQGVDREELDSPARFTLDRATVLMRVRSVQAKTRASRRPPRPEPEPDATQATTVIPAVPPAGRGAQGTTGRGPWDRGESGHESWSRGELPGEHALPTEPVRMARSRDEPSREPRLHGELPGEHATPENPGRESWSRGEHAHPAEPGRVGRRRRSLPGEHALPVQGESLAAEPAYVRRRRAEQASQDEAWGQGEFSQPQQRGADEAWSSGSVLPAQPHRRRRVARPVEPQGVEAWPGERSGWPEENAWPTEAEHHWPDEDETWQPEPEREWPDEPEWTPVPVGAGAAQTVVRPRTMMRPYAHTRGRTRPDYELALETLVSTSDRGLRHQGATSVQHRRICDLCVEPRSIAEIAAFLHLPLNVVKVLVSDMDDLELVVLHQPGLSFGDRSSREFMARVLEGLRAL